MRGNRGFSLVELIIVIAIMAVLIGLLTPQYLKYVEKSRKAKDEKLASELLEVANVIASDEDYFDKISVGDYIQFDSSGISTNNQTIEDEILPDYVSGWENAHIESDEYWNKYYKIEFVNGYQDYKMAIQVGWN